MKNERLRQRKLAKARARHKDYERHVNAELSKPKHKRKFPLIPGVELPKSRKITPKKLKAKEQTIGNST